MSCEMRTSLFSMKYVQVAYCLNDQRECHYNMLPWKTNKKRYEETVTADDVYTIYIAIWYMTQNKYRLKKWYIV